MLTLGTPGGAAEDLEGTNGVAVGDKTVSAVLAGVKERSMPTEEEESANGEERERIPASGGFPDDSCPARPFSRTASAFRPFR